MNQKIKQNLTKYFEDVDSIYLNLSELNKKELKFIKTHFTEVRSARLYISVELTLSDSYEFIAIYSSFDLPCTDYTDFKNLIRDSTRLKKKLK